MPDPPQTLHISPRVSTGSHPTVECFLCFSCPPPHLSHTLKPTHTPAHTPVPQHNADGNACLSLVGAGRAVGRGHTWLCRKLVGTHVPPHFTAALHQKASSAFLRWQQGFAFGAVMAKVMFYLIPQSKGEQKHHTSSCHAPFGLLTHIQHLAALSSPGTADANSCQA